MLSDLLATSERVSATTRRLEKISLLADCLKRADPTDVAIATSYLSGDLPQGRIGLGPAAVRDAWPESGAPASTLSLTDVHEALDRVASISGPGSAVARVHQWRTLLARATRPEQTLLARLVLGELRQGASEGIMVDAVAQAANVPAAEVRRALMFAGILAPVAAAAAQGGIASLRQFSLRIFHPLQPMLAQTADELTDPLERWSTAAFEYKLDGARVHIHKSGSEVRVFSRKLRDLTHAAPELVDTVRALPVREIVLDGEAIALRPDGTPYPFQVTMRRFGRKLDVRRMREELPLTAAFFDCLYLDGEALVDEPSEQRFAVLAKLVPSPVIVPRLVTGAREEAEAFLAAARGAGHEGLVAKALQAPYEAGRRGHGWLKIKPAHTLDLVVLAAEWGHGRRRGWLSNLHLGARDQQSGEYVMLGKTFKGMTDEILAWQTRALQDLAVRRDRHTVYVRPELVVEVAFDGVQTSPRYPGGVALRFARIRGYRSDKSAREVDTMDAVRKILQRVG